MLQIKIIHDGHYMYIQEIKDGDQVLSTFDESANKIELALMVPFIGRKVMISHYVKEGEDLYFDYEHEQTIVAVAQEEDGNWFIEWSE